MCFLRPSCCCRWNSRRADGTSEFAPTAPRLNSRLRRGRQRDAELGFDVLAPRSRALLLGGLVVAGLRHAVIKVDDSRLADEVVVDRDEHQARHDRQKPKNNSSESN